MPAPRIGSFAPTSGPASTEAEIRGRGFTGAMAVDFNATAARFAVEADTLIIATVPARAGSGPIRVGNPAGMAVSPSDFEFSGPIAFTAGEPTLALHPNRPNPFGSATIIRFELFSPVQARLRIYDLDGRLIRTLLDTLLPAGVHCLDWDGLDEDGRPVPSGAYLARLVAGASEATWKLVRVR